MPHPRAADAAVDRAVDPALLQQTRLFDALLRALSAEFPLLGCCTPVNASSEQARLLAAWSSGEEVAPRWRAPDRDRHAVEHARRAVEGALRTIDQAAKEPWLLAYAARFEEAAHDLDVADAAFERGLADAAGRRFEVPAALAADADQRALELLERAAAVEAERAGLPREPRIATDDLHDERSLVCRMRAELARHRLPVSVVVRPRVGALAAAGDGVVIVAEGRLATSKEVERVVLHEIEGHVLPRERGRAHAIGLCTVGARGASEEEEGRALMLEAEAGLMGPERMRSLGSRHVAARMVERGAGYVEVVRALRDKHGVALEDALSVASRVLRGGVLRGGDVRGGIARERVYLPSWLRTERAVASGVVSLPLLGRARLSLQALQMLGAIGSIDLRSLSR